MKKISIFVILSSFFIVTTAAALVYHVLSGNDKAFAQIATSSASSTTSSFPPSVSSSTLPDYLGSVSEVFDTFPTGPTLTIGTSRGVVTVNNFYSSSTPVNMVQDVVFKETQDYLMVYDPTDSSFWIAVTVPNSFSTWQSVAEKDFLQTLGVNTADACNLTVVEGVIYSTGDPNDGKSFPLSLCGASASSTFTQ
jgi:hypothetical protein